jgi:NAD(P)-dependent dehydrogenase (short-subunit alcohol dehydrogenase family)
MSKITLITGGSRGLGRNTALNIARQGGDVIVTYHSNAQAADSIVDEIQALGRKAIAVRLDTGDVASFANFAAALGDALTKTWARDTFDHLVNNAGHGEYTLLGATTEEQFDGLMNVHVKGVYFLTQTLAPMIADNGRIVNLSSGLTRFAFPGYSVYAAMKGAVEVLTRYMAKELGARGITVNTVAPGAIETDFGGGAVRDNPEVNKHVAAGITLGRVGVPDDIGPMIARLLSDDNRWINAQRIEVSGGQMI